MKKILLVMMIVAAGYSLSAQDLIIYKTQTTSSSNAAYVLPDPIRVNYATSYPDAVVVTTWEPAGTSWWSATYKGDNRINHVYYSTQLWYLERDVNFKVSLPVISTYVPEEVITSAINLYGNSLYSVAKMKSANDMEVYQVRLLENGVERSTWMDAQGVVVTDDVFKAKTDDEKVKLKLDNE